MISAVSLGLLVLSKVQTCHSFNHSRTNPIASRFSCVNVLCYFVHQRLLVPFSLMACYSRVCVCVCAY